MAYNCILLRVGEIFLKGRNRNHFEKKLIENIKTIAGVKVKKLRFRYITDYFESHGKLRNIFGLTSYSPALRVEKELEEIKKAALELLSEAAKKAKEKTFRIVAHRADKTFPLKSPEINREVGKFIEGNSSLEFDFNAKQVLTIEINNDGAYLFLETVNCFSGLPTGVSGKVILLVEDEKSLLAGILMMKRGCLLAPVALEKKDISLLQKFSPARLKLNVVKNFSEIEAFAEENEIGVLVVGDNFKDYSALYLSKLAVLKPLIGYGGEEIKEELKKFSVA